MVRVFRRSGEILVVFKVGRESVFGRKNGISKGVFSLRGERGYFFYFRCGKVVYLCIRGRVCGWVKMLVWVWRICGLVECVVVVGGDVGYVFFLLLMGCVC